MANGVVATSKALKEEKVVCVSKQAGKHVRQRDQLGYTRHRLLAHFISFMQKQGFGAKITLKSILISNDNKSIFF